MNFKDLKICKKENKNFRLIINGGTGSVTYGAEKSVLQKGLTMKEFGDCIGVCLHYQSPDDQAGEIADEEITKKGNKKKKELLTAQFKKDYNLRDQLRALIFREGICVMETN